MGNPLISPVYRGITFILQAIIFRVVPTALEISMVCGILVRHLPCFLHHTCAFGSFLNLYRLLCKLLFVPDPPPDVAIWFQFCSSRGWHNGRLHMVHCPDDIVAVRFFLAKLSPLSAIICRRDLVGGTTHILLTCRLHHRTKFRRDANKADNKAATVAVDSLINYEAVKVTRPPSLLCRNLTLCQHFNNEPYEIAQYDRHLKSYEQSSLKIATSLAFLNSGQNVIFSSGLTLVMFFAAQGVVNGAIVSNSRG